MLDQIGSQRAASELGFRYDRIAAGSLIILAVWVSDQYEVFGHHDQTLSPLSRRLDYDRSILEAGANLAVWTAVDIAMHGLTWHFCLWCRKVVRESVMTAALSMQSNHYCNAINDVWNDRGDSHGGMKQRP